VDFEWQSEKAVLNERKHSIPFPFASRVFLDENRLESLNARKHYAEVRWITIGRVDQFEIVIVYTLRMEVIRIISARKADRHEREAYRNR
jgi:uncharacterized DUF497 family protein